MSLECFIDHHANNNLRRMADISTEEKVDRNI